MEKNNKEIIPVFFTVDNGYVPYLGVAIHSIKANASKAYAYKMIVVHEDISEENKARLADLAGDDFDIELVEMKTGLEDITERRENLLRCDYFTLTIYYRIFIAKMFPQYDKGIYIDSDVVVPGDISDLYNLDLEGHIIAACPDHSVSDVEPLARYVEEVVGVDRFRYINSGVLLMNLKKMREKQFSEHFLKLLNTYHFDSVAPDQDYINAICNGDVLFLGREWDAMPNKRKPPVENPCLIHYNLFDKPWYVDDVQYEEYFWKYASETVFYDEIREFKQGYSEEQMALNEKCMGNLVDRAVQITENENVTFRKMHENGVDIRL